MRDPGKIRYMWKPVRHVYHLKIFEKHDIEVSITAWFSHAMPRNGNLVTLKMYENSFLCLVLVEKNLRKMVNFPCLAPP